LFLWVNGNCAGNKPIQTDVIPRFIIFVFFSFSLSWSREMCPEVCGSCNAFVQGIRQDSAENQRTPGTSTCSMSSLAMLDEQRAFTNISKNHFRKACSTDFDQHRQKSLRKGVQNKNNEQATEPESPQIVDDAASGLAFPLNKKRDGGLKVFPRQKSSGLAFSHYKYIKTSYKCWGRGVATRL
jgi:hypothetical protein